LLFRLISGTFDGMITSLFTALLIALSPPAEQPGDLTYCPADGVWSTEWHACPPLPHRGYHVDEHSPTFDCRVDGDQVCGPGNVQDVAPGFYGKR